MLDNNFEMNKGIMMEGFLDLGNCDEFKNDKVDILSKKGKDILRNENRNILRDRRFAGIYIEYEKEKGTVFLFDARGVVRYGSVNSDGLSFHCEGHINREIKFNTIPKFRLILKKFLLELYLDDILIQAHTLIKPATGKIGLIFNRNKELLKGICVWSTR